MEGRRLAEVTGSDLLAMREAMKAFRESVAREKYWVQRPGEFLLI